MVLVNDRGCVYTQEVEEEEEEVVCVCVCE